MENVTKKSFRLALIASEHTVSEYSIFLEHLMVGLVDESIPVALVCPSVFNADYMFTGAAEVITHPVFDVPFTGHLNRGLLIERLAKFKPTILHCLCETRALLTRRLTRRLLLPYVLTVNSLPKSLFQFSVSSRRCVKIITPAKRVAADIAGAYPRFADRLEQINVGTFVAESNGCFSGSSGLTTIVMAHPLDNADDFENLFKALRHLMLDGYEFVMVVIGGGPAEGQLRKLLTALGLSQIVTIIPRLRPLRLVLATGDIFIQPQPNSAFNPLLLEAMSVGSAVAACKGGVDDLIIDDKTAVVFDPNDELSIVAALQRLLDGHDFARKIAKAAQEHLRQNHTVSKMISDTLQTYHEALRKESPEQQWQKG